MIFVPETKGKTLREIQAFFVPSVLDEPDTVAAVVPVHNEAFKDEENAAVVPEYNEAFKDEENKYKSDLKSEECGFCIFCPCIFD